jgi:hypothetical protein
MKQYKVYGDKLINYYTVVTANDQEHAWDFAANNNSIDWFQIEDDNAIEPYDVQLVEDKEFIDEPVFSSNSIEEDLPSMDSGILISDKSDI